MITWRENDGSILEIIAALRYLSGGAISVFPDNRFDKRIVDRRCVVKHLEYNSFRFGAAYVSAKHTVCVANGMRIANHASVAFFYPNRLVAQALDLLVIVRHDKDGDIVIFD